MQVLFIIALFALAEIADAQRGGRGRGGRNGGNGGNRRPNGGNRPRPDGGNRPPRPDGGNRPPRPDEPEVGNPSPPRQPRVECTGRRGPQLDEPYTRRDACALTRDIEGFLVAYEEEAVCDGLFQDDPESATWCKVIKKTADEFAAFPLQIDWCDATNEFPDVCSTDGRSFSPTVCNICTTIRDQHVNSSCNPDWEALTNAVVALFTAQPQCEAAIRSRGRGNNRRYGYGFGFCNYVFQINGDYGCQKWTDTVASCPGEEDPKVCFGTRLISTLIQTAGYTLYESDVCIKTLEASDRILGGIVV